MCTMEESSIQSSSIGENKTFYTFPVSDLLHYNHTNFFYITFE